MKKVFLIFVVALSFGSSNVMSGGNGNDLEPQIEDYVWDPFGTGGSGAVKNGHYMRDDQGNIIACVAGGNECQYE